MKMRIIFLVSLMGIIGCSSLDKIHSIKPGANDDASARRELLIGKWYGEATTIEGSTRKSLMQRRADGTYTIKFQIWFNGKLKEQQVEAGIWGVSGPIYFTATREMLLGSEFKSVPVDDPTYYDAYQIESLSKDVFAYKSVETPDSFRVQRVPESFEIH